MKSEGGDLVGRSGGGESVVLVQKDLVGGRYGFEGKSEIPGCTSEIQVVLNSVAPGMPTPARPRTQPFVLPAPIVVSTTIADSFTVTELGRYMVTAEAQWSARAPCSGDLGLIGPDQSRTNVPGGSKLVTLGAGVWEMDARTECPWSMTAKPYTEGGGGTVGF